MLCDLEPPAGPLWARRQVQELDYIYKPDSARTLNIQSCNRRGDLRLEGSPLLLREGGAPRATRNTEAGTRQPTFSHLYLKGTAKPTLDTAFSLLSVEIKRLNTTKADSLKGYIQTQVWVLLFFFNIFLSFSFF